MSLRLPAFCLALCWAAAGAIPAGQQAPPAASAVQRFQNRAVRTPVSYRATRHLEAHNPRFNKSAWLDVVTAFDAGRMTYTIIGRGGSDLVQNRVLIAALETERELLRDGRDPVAITAANYRIADAGYGADGYGRISLTPVRKDKRLIDGHLLVTPEGDLVEFSGRLSKSPSFWTKSVTLTRRYRQLAGVRVPESVTSVADVRIAGRSTFSMTYAFEMIDGGRVEK